MSKNYNELAPIISAQALRARSAILHMTTLNGAGHPGGSMSSIDILLSLYNTIKHDPQDPDMPDRDMVVVSMGHISPAVYSTLGIMGYFPLDDATALYRVFGSMYEGHIERDVPGVEWTTGNLGQGLSAGTGFAIAAKIKQTNQHVYVLMGDGEQQKGQISEARRFAAKYKLDNLIAIVDYNQLQISGSIHDVMPQNIRKNWESDGWLVMEVNGHDIQQVLHTLDHAREAQEPVMILAHTVMGKGVSFMEHNNKYHGSTLSIPQFEEAVKELGIENQIDLYRKIRNDFKPTPEPVHKRNFHPRYDYDPGKPMLYSNDSDCRSAWGNALADLAKINSVAINPIVAIDCDLASSVKTDGLKAVAPSLFLQCGIMEHHAAVMGGAISTTGIQCFWSDFGVFGIDEVYNMQRLNDINHANFKTVVTHVGMDVGQDGKTHQCIDYISLARNLFNTRLICPADANHTDRIIRWLVNQPGNYLVTMGRSKLPILKNTDNDAFYNEEYDFTFGAVDVLRVGNQGTVMVTGSPAGRALKAIDALREEGIFIELVYVSSPLSIPEPIVKEAAAKGFIITMEDHSINGGLGTSIAEALATGNLQAKLIKIGVTQYPVSGESDELYKWMGMDTATIIKRIKAEI